MVVADLMVHEVVTLTPEDLLFDAVLKMNDYHIRHLPVVDNGRLVGIISNRDIRLLAKDLPEAQRAEGRYNLSLEARVGEVMEVDPIVTGPDVELGEVLEVFLEEKVGAIPVVAEDKRLVGIIGYIDLLEILREKL